MAERYISSLPARHKISVKKKIRSISTWKGFVEVSKNLVGYKSKHNFVGASKCRM